MVAGIYAYQNVISWDSIGALYPPKPTTRKKLAIAIPPKPVQSLEDSRLTKHCARPVGRQ